VQTRQWLWRQSEIGKMTTATTDAFFQLVGFDGVHLGKLERGMDRLEICIREKFGGSSRRFLVDKDQPEIAF